MRERLHGARETVAEQTGVHWSMTVWRTGAVMMLTFASTGLQAQNQPQTAQSPGQATATAQNQAPSPTAFPTPSIPGPLQTPPGTRSKPVHSGS